MIVCGGGKGRVAVANEGSVFFECPAGMGNFLFAEGIGAGPISDEGNGVFWDGIGGAAGRDDGSSQGGESNYAVYFRGLVLVVRG